MGYMYIIKYYDPAWGGWRRFDSFGDSVYPAEVATDKEARQVAEDYLSTRPVATKAKVQITDPEGKVTVINVRVRRGKRVETTA